MTLSPDEGKGNSGLPLTLQRHGQGPSRHPTVSQSNRKKVNIGGQRLIVRAGLGWRKDNGLVISHVNIFRMPIASRQPFTSDICEERRSWGKVGKQDTPA